MRNVDKWEHDTNDRPKEPLKWWESLGSYLYWYATGRLPLWHEIRIINSQERDENDNG